MPDVATALVIFSLPFLLGLISGSQMTAAVRQGTGFIAFLGLLPAAYLVVKSELPGSHCAGGECIGDGIALMFALVIAAVSLGYLVGGLIAHFRQSAPEKAASTRHVVRWLMVGVIGMMILKIALVYAQTYAVHHGRGPSMEFRRSEP